MLLILVLSAVGSFFNIPLGKRKIVVVQKPYFFGLFKKSYAAIQGISINVGGAIIPMILALYFLFKAPIQPALLATFFMIVVSYAFSRVIPGRGVAVSPFLVAVMALLFAFIISPKYVAPIAFSSGVLGVLVGADLLRIPKILKQEGGVVLCIGGAGVFDGIFLIGIISALISRL